MNALQHHKAILAAELAVKEALDNLNNVRAAACSISPVKIGQCVPAQTAGGSNCMMEVTGVWVGTNKSASHLSVRLTGKKFKKDGSLANIACYAFLSIPFESEAIAPEEDRWVPAHNGKEVPFKTRTGRRLQYLWNPGTGKHAYIDCDTDIILSDDEARLALGMD